MHLRIVCPESCAFEGEVAYVALPATTGEIGVLPHHASEICTVKPGYARVSDRSMGTYEHIIAIDEGYAQVADDTVIVLTARAADLASVDRAAVEGQLQGFEEELSKTSESDVRRAYLYNEVAWCKQLLEYEARP